MWSARYDLDFKVPIIQNNGSRAFHTWSYRLGLLGTLLQLKAIAVYFKRTLMRVNTSSIHPFYSIARLARINHSPLLFYVILVLLRFIFFTNYPSVARRWLKFRSVEGNVLMHKCFKALLQCVMCITIYRIAFVYRLTAVQ